MTFRLYKLDASPGNGKVFISNPIIPASKKQTGAGLVTTTITKPPAQNKVNPNIEDLQMKLNALSSVKMTRNGKQIKRFVNL